MSGKARPLESWYADARGLSPAERARAMERGRQTIFHLHRAVQARDAHMVQRIADGLAPEEVWACLLLAVESADLLRLKYVKDQPDNGMPHDLRLVTVA